MVCNQCGTDNAPGAGFCAVCGANLNAQAPTTNPPPAYYAPPQEQQSYPNYSAPVQNTYNQPPYQGQNPYPPQYNYGGQNPVPMEQPGKSMAIASLVCGIISLICFAIIAGPLGIIFGVIAKNKGYKGGMATAGIVCGAIGVGLWVILMIAGVSMGAMFGY